MILQHDDNESETENNTRSEGIFLQLTHKFFEQAKISIQSITHLRQFPSPPEISS